MMEYLSSRPFTPEEATEFINKIATYADLEIAYTGHCKEQMILRGFTFQDLLLLFSNGKVNSQPEYDENYQDYKYKVEGTTLDDDQGSVITVILDSRKLLAITIF
jgi:hypothetical protein